MPTIANLVLGRDGSSRLGSDARGLSTAEDREHFLAQRRSRDCIIIGGETAQRPGYEKSPCPIIVLSHRRPALLDRNSAARWWQLSPALAIERAHREFGATIGVECGPRLLTAFLEVGLIDRLELSITPIEGGEGKIAATQLLAHFARIDLQEVGETQFYSCTEPITR